MAYKIFKSSDIGAPSPTIAAALSAADLKAAIIQILDACLINGYGARTPPTGWSKPYPDDGTFAMYKSAQGHCFRIEEAFTQTNFLNRVNIVAYESDPGSLNFATRTDVFKTLVFTTGSYSSTQSETFSLGTAYWIVFASSNSFAILISGNIASGSPKSYLFWSGKITNTETGEIGVAQVGGGYLYNSYPSICRWKTFDAGGRNQYKTPSISSFVSGFYLFGAVSTQNYPSNPSAGGSSPLSEGKIRYAPVKIVDAVTGVYQGNLEGLITLEHAGGGFLQHGDTITINGKLYFVCLFLPKAKDTYFSTWTLNSDKAFLLFEYDISI